MGQTMKCAVMCFLVCGSGYTIFTNSYSGESLIVDTSQNSCYDGDGVTIDCLTDGVAFYGQDAQTDGNQFSYTDNDDGTVVDNVTGLMWQQTSLETGFNYEEGKEYCESLELGGYDDWRLPTTKQLCLISDFSEGWPYIDTVYFDLAAGPEEGDMPSEVANALGIETPLNSQPDDVGSGGGGSVSDNYVRCVRGNSSYGINVFENNGDGTITDHATGLMWQQDDSAEVMDWETALVYAEDATIAGYENWRLPNLKERQSILDYTHSPSSSDPANLGPAIDTNFFIITELPTGTTGYDSGYGNLGSITNANFEGDSLESHYAGYVAFLTAGYNDGYETHGAAFDNKYEGEPLGEGGERYYNYVRLVRNTRKLDDLNQDGIVDRADLLLLKRFVREQLTGM